MTGRRILNPSTNKRVLDATGKPILDKCCCGSGSGGQCFSCSDTMGLSATLSFSGLSYQSSCGLLPTCGVFGNPTYGYTHDTLGSYCVPLARCGGFATGPFKIHLFEQDSYCTPGVLEYHGIDGSPPAITAAQITLAKGGTVPGSAKWVLQVDAINNFVLDFSLFYGTVTIDDCTSSVTISNQLTSLCSFAGTSFPAFAWGGSCSITINAGAC